MLQEQNSPTSMVDYLKVKETDRLLIRPITTKDLPLWVDFLAQEKATRYFPDYMKHSALEAKNWVIKQQYRYSIHAFGLMAIIEKSSNQFIGQCGLLTQEIDGRDELEIGYHLLPAYWGKGFATEGALFFKDYGFENNLAPSIISIIHVDNVPSQNVALRNGMTREEQTIVGDIEAYIFRITRCAWEQEKQDKSAH